MHVFCSCLLTVPDFPHGQPAAPLLPCRHTLCGGRVPTAVTAALNQLHLAAAWPDIATCLDATRRCPRATCGSRVTT